MDLVQTQIVKDDKDVDSRVRELGLQRSGLLACRDAAIAAALDCSPLFPANSPGTFAYHFGTRELRAQFVGKEWAIDRADGIESIKNDTLRLKVVYQNVDFACSDDHLPAPRSPKGSGAERACSGNLFGSLPSYSRPIARGWSTYYLMVDENGGVELSLAVVEGRTFTSFVERIYLSRGGDIGDLELLDAGPDDYAGGFDVNVARR